MVPSFVTAYPPFLQLKDLAKATGMAWVLAAGIDAPSTDKLDHQLISYVHGTAEMKQLVMHEEDEHLSTKAISALTGDLTGSDPQAK